MSSLALLFAAGLFAGALLLWDRWRAEDIAVPTLPQEARDADRVWAADAQGVRALPVPHREVHDPYRTIGELLAALEGQQLAEPERRLKALYQLEGALGVAPTELHAAQDALVGRRVMDQTIARIGVIEPGALVDRRTMRPLGPGSRVRQPLGAIGYSEDGRVLLKAKVVTG